MKHPLFFALALGVVVGCASENAEIASQSMPESGGSSKAAVADMSAPAERNGFSQTSNSPASPPAVIQNRMVIRTASLSVRVDSVEKSENAVNKIVQSFGGYVDSASSSDLASARPVLNLSMRVPSQNFDDVLNQIESLGVRTAKTISSEDVTEQVVDLDARIKTLKVEEETYRNLLRSTRAMNDLISLNQRLTEIRSTIESITGQRASLAKRASLSSISLVLEQGAVPHQTPNDPNWMAQTWAESTTELGGFLRGLAVVGIWFAVFSPLWLPVLYFLARAAKARAKPVHPIYPEI